MNQAHLETPLFVDCDIDELCDLWFLEVESVVCVCARALSYSVVSDSCDPMDYSPPGFSIHGIFQAKYWGG